MIYLSLLELIKTIFIRGENLFELNCFSPFYLGILILS